MTEKYRYKGNIVIGVIVIRVGPLYRQETAKYGRGNSQYIFYLISLREPRAEQVFFTLREREESSSDSSRRVPVTQSRTGFLYVTGMRREFPGFFASRSHNAEENISDIRAARCCVSAWQQELSSFLSFHHPSHTHARPHAHTHTPVGPFDAQRHDSDATAGAITACAGIAPFNSLQG